MELNLLRHAESEFNKIGLLQGRIDCNLSEEGIRKTKERAKNFDSNYYDICFSSPLKRTLQTAKILVPNLKIICDERIIERSLGDWENTPISDEKSFSLKNIEKRPPNGELITDVAKRVEDFIDFLKENYEGKKILVVTHAGVIYAFQRVLNLKVEGVNNLDIVKIKI